MTDTILTKTEKALLIFGPVAITMTILFGNVAWQLDHFQKSCVTHGYCHHDPNDGHLVWQDGKDAP